jgi:cysteinyl-tRNA synthetase
VVTPVHSSKLRIYNTLSKDIEEFQPINKDKVGIYACGLTVNDYMHIGHARTYLIWDVLVRYLRFKGYKVTYVSNVTDISIDDKILKRLKEENISFQQLIEKYTMAYFEDRESIGLLRADVHPLATQHIQEMIELIKKLIEKDYGYVTEDGVYFNISKFKEYGKLSGIRSQELIAGAGGRIKADEYDKENVGDFALWKKTNTDEPYWYSPWGIGRPGWHIECSAMSMKYLGESFDIHTGGEDNIFPHHENEIAQSEAATGKRFVKYWLHTRHVLLGGEKMSKSYKKLIYLRDAVKKFGSLNLRLYLLQTHYRKQLLYDEKGIEEASLTVNRIKKAIQFLQLFILKNISSNVGENLIDTIENKRIEFIEAMDDDLNTPLAIKSLQDIAKEILQYIESYGPIDSKFSLKILEILDPIITIIFGNLYSREIRIDMSKYFWIVEKMLEERNLLRKEGNFEKADIIRNKLKEMGIEIEDFKFGSLWYISKIT